MVRANNEKRRRICLEKSDDSGCAGEEKEMQTEAGVGGPHQA